MDESPAKRIKLTRSKPQEQLNNQNVDCTKEKSDKSFFNPENSTLQEEGELSLADTQPPNEQKISKNKLLLENDEISDEEDVLESEPEDEKDDPFSIHLDSEISSDLLKDIETRATENLILNWPVLKNLRFTKYLKSSVSAMAPKDLTSLYIKPELVANIPAAQAACQRVKESASKSKTPSQFSVEILNIISNYHDLLFTERTFGNGEEIRLSYCVHALNHVLKTRSLIVHHNKKLSKKSDCTLEFSDQGFTRPKVLILVPFKEAALRVVNLIIRLLMSDKKGNVLNKKRFKMDYVSNEAPPSKLNKRPDDFEATFAGNIDDSFRLGITVTRRSMKLYAGFYSSDIIVASPLGLRTIIGAEGEKERDFDFLSSIELLILDQADIFLMQNWEHILHILQHLHLQPTQARNTDFSRIRTWTLNGWSKHYRQTLLFSSINHPMLSAIFNRSCTNYAGRFCTFNPSLITALSQVLLQVPQVFHRFEPNSLESLPEDRLKFFLTKVLVHFKDPVMSHTLIYIPSYFDFVRVRNYFRKEEISFTQICEYSKDGKVARARDMFFHSQKHFLLFTERFHFYHRYMIKGVRHVIFYELPTYPHFYSEMSNLLHQRFQAKQRPADNSSVAVLYSKYEVQQLTAVVGQDRARTMISSDKKVHMFVTER